MRTLHNCKLLILACRNLEFKANLEYFHSLDSKPPISANPAYILLTMKVNLKKFIGLHLLFTALLGFTSVANAGFEAEPNDSLATASPMKLNEVYTGSFDNSNPSYDYYKLSLTKPTEIVFHFRNTMSDSSSVYFYVLNNLGEQVFFASSIGSDLLDHSFRVNLVAGVFYTRVRSDFTNKSYELSALSPISVPRPITMPSVVDSVNLPDLNSNGYKDMAVLRILADTRAVVDTIDGFTGALLKRIVYISDSRLVQPISIISFDLDNNGSPDIGVLGYNSTTGKHAQYVRNALTGQLVKAFVIN